MIPPPPRPTFLWRVKMTVPGDAVGAFEKMLDPHCMAISSFKENGHWRIEGSRVLALPLPEIRRAFQIPAL